MLGPVGTEGRHELSKRAKRPLLQRRSAKIEIHGDQIILGKPVIFNKANIDQFNF